MSAITPASARSFGRAVPQAVGAVVASAIAHATLAAVLWAGHDAAAPEGAAVVQIEAVFYEADPLPMPGRVAHSAHLGVAAANAGATEPSGGAVAEPAEASPVIAPVPPAVPQKLASRMQPAPDPVREQMRQPEPAQLQKPVNLESALPPDRAPKPPPVETATHPPVRETLPDAGPKGAPAPRVLAQSAEKRSDEPVRAARAGQPAEETASLGLASLAATISGPLFSPGSAANPLPHYPLRARRAGLEGRVMLRVAVDASGRPRTVSVAESSGYTILDNAARAAVEGWQFTPAREGLNTTAAEVAVPIRFRLDE